MGHVARMTLTGMIGFVFIFAVDAINLYWLSQTGDTTLVAAAGFAMAIQVISLAGGISMMVASSALISRALGAGEAELARRQTASGAVIAAVVQGIVAALLISFRHPVLAFLGAEGEVAAQAAHYLVVSLPALTVLGAGMVINGAIRAQGDARRSVGVTMLGGLVSAILGYVLIHRAGLGLTGAALSVSAAQCVSFLLAFRVARRVHDLLARPRAADIRATFGPFMVIAVPAMLSQLARPVGLAVLVMVMAPFGEEAVAGWTVLSRLIMVAFGGLLSLAAMIGGIFGQNYGAGRIDRVRRTFRDATIFGVAYVLVVWALLIWVTEPAIRAFGVTGLGADVLRAFTHYGAGGYVFAAMLFVNGAALNVLGRPHWATGFAWVREVALTWPAAVLMAGWFGAVGVVYSQIVVSMIIGTAAWLVGLWYIRSLKPGSVAPSATTPTLAE